MKLLRGARVLVCLVPLAVSGQTAGTRNLFAANPAAEQAELSQAVAEANGSQVDLTRVLEEHLAKYPDCPRRADIESTLYKNAVQANDNARVVRYGEKLLESGPADEMAILDRVLHSLLATNDVEAARKAFVDSRRYEADANAMRARAPEGHTTAAQWADLADQALSARDRAGSPGGTAIWEMRRERWRTRSDRGTLRRIRKRRRRWRAGW